MTILKFGVHKGKSIQDVPDDYLEWMVKSSQASIDMAMKELQRRQSVNDASMPMVERILAAGYKALAKQYHPDVNKDGGKLMQELNGTYEALKQARGSNK